MDGGELLMPWVAPLLFIGGVLLLIFLGIIGARVNVSAGAGV